MGILKSTYIINDNSSEAINRQNSIISELKETIEKQNNIANKTRNRANISLSEYENLKKDLEKSKNILNLYENFYHNLGKKLKMDPHKLLDLDLVDIKIFRNPVTLKTIIDIEFEMKTICLK